MLLTKELKKALQTAKSIAIDFAPIEGLASYERDRKTVTLRLHFEAEGKKTTQEYTEFSGRIANGHRDAVRKMASGFGSPYVVYDNDDNTYEPKGGTWLLMYSNHDNSVQSIFRSIPVGSKLHFTVGLDWHSSAAHAEVKFHGDSLQVQATPPAGKNGKESRDLTFELASVAGFHNTARFGWNRT